MATANAKVKFAFGTIAKYNALATKDDNTVYFLTDGQVYQGTALVGDAKQSSVNKKTIGDISNLQTTAKNDLVTAINEVKNSTNNISSKDISVTETDAGYQISQGGVVKVTIPKDTAVSSGELVTASSTVPVTIGSTSYTSGQFLKLIIKNQSNPVYINVAELMNVYSGQSGDMVNVSVSGTHISASINDASITKAKLASSVQSSLNKADSALQTHQKISTGSTNGTISVDGTDVAVKGLGSAAYTNGPATMTGATASVAGEAGIVPAPSAGTQDKYLRGDGTWQTPPDTNTTYTDATSSTAGLMSAVDKSNVDAMVKALTWKNV